MFFFGLVQVPTFKAGKDRTPVDAKSKAKGRAGRLSYASPTTYDQQPSRKSMTATIGSYPRFDPTLPAAHEPIPRRASTTRDVLIFLARPLAALQGGPNVTHERVSSLPSQRRSFFGIGVCFFIVFQIPRLQHAHRIGRNCLFYSLVGSFVSPASRVRICTDTQPRAWTAVV